MLFCSGTFYKTLVEYHNQALDIDAVPVFIAIAPVFLGLICMCLCVFNSMQFYHTRRLAYPPPKLSKE